MSPVIPIPARPPAGGGGGTPKHAVTVVADPVFALTHAAAVADGAFTDLLPGGLTAQITNPSVEHPMLVVATVQLPNLNLSTRDGAGNLTNQPLGATRISVLSHVETGNDTTEAFSGDAERAATGIPFIVPPIHLTLTRTIAAGATANFSVTDWLTSVDFDTANSANVRVGTQEQGYPNRARLVLQGTVQIP